MAEETISAIIVSTIKPGYRSYKKKKLMWSIIFVDRIDYDRSTDDSK